VPGGAIIRSGSDTVPGATGPEDVSWARRQIEQELSPCSRAVSPWGVASCHPSTAGTWAWTAASNPVIATTTATTDARTASGVERSDGINDGDRMKGATLNPARRGVKQGQGFL